MAQRRQSIWQSRYLGIRTMSRSIAVSASSADGRPQMRPYEGRRLRQGLLDKSNTASGVWADTAYRSVANETFLTKNGFVSHIHRKKPKGRETLVSVTCPGGRVHIEEIAESNSASCVAASGPAIALCIRP
jgi:hypothetical protein